MKKPILIFLLLLSNLSFQLFSQISGIILDEHTQTGLPLANVLLLPDSVYTVSDFDGNFFFNNLKDGDYKIYISYIGFEPYSVNTQVKNQKSPKLNILLEPNHATLHTIEITDEHAKQEESLNTEHIHQDFLKENLQGTLAKSIEKLPGISSINVGVGIAKPVIRGLSSNRIIVNHQGIKQEGQQWGSDHGLEIDQFDVERVEIIKGPGSLQYGSDGLGGVINIMPSKILPKNMYRASLLGVYKTNNDHFGGSAHIGFNKNNVFVNARYSRQDFADYRVPATEFTYNDFILPILDKTLKNTAGDEESFSVAVGTSQKWGVTRLHFSKYFLEAGLFSGAVGIPRSYQLEDDFNNRDIDIPKQEVTHYRVSINQAFILGEDHVVIDAGFQRNLRQEFSNPEFHSIRASELNPNNNLALELALETFSLGAHYEDHLRHEHDENDWKFVYGFNTQWQDNERGGFEILLPNFKTFRGGIFSIAEKKLKDNWLINGGLRLDYGENHTEFYQQYVYDSNENILDSLSAPKTDHRFFNWSASIGSNLTLKGGEWVLKTNIGKSFRVPYPSETVSNGIHHGTFRHEVGTPDLASEQGYQLDASLDWNREKFWGSIALYFNYFDNYIYLAPTGRFSPLPEAGQLYRYRQDDAIYTGGELQWRYKIFSFLSVYQAIDFIQSYNPQTNLALPFTPQPSIKTDLRYSPSTKSWLEDFYLEVSHQYHFAASGPLRVDRSERSTPAYDLWGFACGFELKMGKQKVDLNFQVQNALNTSYLNHLSRYRLINVPEQGRNFVCSLKIPFNGKLGK